MWPSLSFAALLVFFSIEACAQSLDETWTLTIAGQSVQANPDGTFRIDNISAPDQFGDEGPGSPPDFLSDDYFRLTGQSVNDGVTHYVFSRPFRVRQGETITIAYLDLTFTDFPPPATDLLRLEADRQTLTRIGQTTQVRATALLSTGDIEDVTAKERWTVYRTSNADVATVDDTGVVTAVSPGMVFITAVNEGVTAVTQIDVVEGENLTTITGFVVGEADGIPIAGVRINAGGLAAFGVSDAEGLFVIEDVPTTFPILTLSVESVDGVFLIGYSRDVEVVKGGITDGGIIRATTLAALTSSPCNDQDADCLLAEFELLYGLDPFDSDTDDNGVEDGDEDPDGDDLSNRVEAFLGTNPLVADTDGDGSDDRAEVVDHSTDPLIPDSDGDGIDDGEEVIEGEDGWITDVLNPDTDGDGWEDGIEVRDSTNPLDENSQPRLFVTGRPQLLVGRDPPARLGEGHAFVVGQPTLTVTRSFDSDAGTSLVLGIPRVVVAKEDIPGSEGLEFVLTRPPLMIHLETRASNLSPAIIVARPREIEIVRNDSGFADGGIFVLSRPPILVSSNATDQSDTHGIVLASPPKLQVSKGESVPDNGLQFVHAAPGVFQIIRETSDSDSGRAIHVGMPSIVHIHRLPDSRSGRGEALVLGIPSPISLNRRRVSDEIGTRGLTFGRPSRISILGSDENFGVGGHGLVVADPANVGVVKPNENSERGLINVGRPPVDVDRRESSEGNAN